MTKTRTDTGHAAADRVALRVAFLGFGEAGAILARDLVAGGAAASAYDPRLEGKAGSELRDRAETLGVRVAGSEREACAEAALVVSAVTASAALDVARGASAYVAEGQLFLDVNSVAPETRRRAAALVEGAGGRYVEAAVMGPLPPQGIAVPMLLGGPWAADAKALLEPFGANLEVVAGEIGLASAIKLSRSLMTKGIEALAVECMLTASYYGTEAQVIDSMNRTYPGTDWEARMAYLLSRVMLHGRRRAEEMREAAKMVEAAGIAPLMASATAERQDWVARLGVGEAARGAGTPELAALTRALRARVGE